MEEHHFPGLLLLARSAHDGGFVQHCLQRALSPMAYQLHPTSALKPRAPYPAHLPMLQLNCCGAQNRT